MKLLYITIFILSGFLISLNASENKPGLSLTLSSADGKKDYRTSRLIALRVPKGEAASPFISEGKFTARWEGFITTQARRRIYFSAKGNGKMKMTLIISDDKKIELSREGNFSEGGETERHRINAGTYKVIVDYESLADQDSFIRVYWREDKRQWPTEPIPPTVLSHKPTVELKSSIEKRHGRALIADLNCTKCHSADAGLNGMPELKADAPSFEGIGSRLNSDWMHAWIKDPKALRPQAKMPHVDLSKSELNDVVAYLASLEKKEDPIANGDIKKGGGLYHDLGCVSCHQSPDSKTENDYNRISLKNVNAKFKSGALKSFLKKPNKHYKWVRMPDFGLSDTEASDLAAFLRSKYKATFPKFAGGDLKKGKALVNDKGCMSCHSPNDAKLPESLKMPELKNIKAADCKTMSYKLAETDKQAITSFLTSKDATTSLKKHSLIESSNRQINALNCAACHVRDGINDTWTSLEGETAHLKIEHKNIGHLDQSRPLITWMGEKLNADWTEKLIKGTLPYKPRPWLLGRMPIFESRAKILAHGQAYDHGFPIKDEVKPKDDKLAVHGSKLTGAEGFSCIICHDSGKGKAIAAFEVKGLNLGLSVERLRHEYYKRWMLDPARIVSHTKMPRYSSDGTTALPILEGDANKQYDAIWEYLKGGMKMTPPKGAK